MVVEQIMTKNPVTASATMSVRSVINLLYELDVRHVPVVDGGELVGILSDRDLREVAAPLLAQEELTGEGSERLEQPISRLMSSDVVSVNPETDLSEVVDLMVEHRIGAVPVVAPKSQDLVGIVSYIDVLKAASRVL